MKRLLALIFGLLLIACCYANRDNGMVQDAAQLLPVSALAVSTCPEGYLMTIESIQQDSLDCDAARALSEKLGVYQAVRLHGYIEKARSAVESNVNIPLVIASLCAEIISTV